jgi:hypothetical protein
MLKTASNYYNAIGALVFKGAWDASTNTPTLTSSVGDKGDYYVVSVAGNTNLNGITDWQLGDWAIFNGSVWQKVDNTDLVISVNGQQGVVNLSAVDVGATPNTAYVIAGNNLDGGGQLTGNVTIDLNSVPIANVAGGVPDTRFVNAAGLLTGGGNLASDVTISLTSVPSANVTGLGTMATQNANNVVITGGSVQNVLLANITTTDLTGYLYGNASGSNVTASTTIPVGVVTGAVPNTVNVIAGTGLSGGGALSGNVTLNLANTAVTANTYGNASNVAQVTIDAQGRITNAVNVPIAISNSAVSGLGTMAIQNANNVNITGGTITGVATVSAANVVVTSSFSANLSTSSSATFVTSSLPLVPEGYLIININGVAKKIPYYGV